MAGSRFAVFVEGIKDLKDFEKLGKDIPLATVQAINKTADWARKRGADEIEDQVAFPRGYLSPSGRRFYVSRKATKSNREARITARGRPTSLARFIKGTAAPKQVGVTVQVDPGKSVELPRAFVIRLPAGKGPVETRSNLGLAVRLPKGQTMRNKLRSVKMANGLYLLYGPSIQQVFLNNAGEGVADEMSPAVLDKLEDEFLRLMGL